MEPYTINNFFGVISVGFGVVCLMLLLAACAGRILRHIRRKYYE